MFNTLLAIGVVVAAVAVGLIAFFAFMFLIIMFGERDE